MPWPFRPRRLRPWLFLIVCGVGCDGGGKAAFKRGFSSAILELPDCGCETEDHRGILLVSANAIVSEVLQKLHSIWQCIFVVLL